MFTTLRIMGSESVEGSESSAKKPLSPWLGVLASFMITGAGPFLAGKRRRGMMWFLSAPFASLLALYLLASPSIPGIIPGILFLVVYTFGVWIDGYRPLKRGQKLQWLIIILLFVTFEILTQTYKRQYLSLFPVRAFKVPTNAMAPTINGKQKLPNGTKTMEDHVFVERWSYWSHDPQRGDLIVFNTGKLQVPHPGEQYVKRVVGLPGDTISINNGQVWISGTPLAKPAVFRKLKYVNFRFVTRICG